MGEARKVSELLSLVVEHIGGTPRDGQLAMAEAVGGAMAAGGDPDANSTLLVQAGTGTGKSMAYLTAALAHVEAGRQGPADSSSMEQDDDAEPRVVIATATLALQHQLMSKDIPTLLEATGAKCSVALLKGRSNYVCLSKLHGGGAPDDEGALISEAAATFGRLEQQAKDLRTWAEATATGDRDEAPEVDARVWRSMSVSARECVGAQRCEFGEDCFAEAARARAAKSDIIVTNHALLALHVLENIPVLPEHDAVVIDEAHELPDRATGAVTAELSAALVERAASMGRALLSERSRELLEASSDALDAALDDLEQDEQRIRVMGEGLVLSLTSLREAASTAIADLGREPENDPQRMAVRHRLKTTLEDIHDVAGRMVEFRDADVLWAERGAGRKSALKVAPLSVAGYLGQNLFAERSVTMTSATLTLGGEFKAIAASVGLDEGEWDGLDVGSPFDYAKQGILYVPAHFDRPDRDGLSDDNWGELADLIVASGGGALALLSSWRSVDRISELLPELLKARGCDVNVLVQKRGESVGRLVSKFADDHHSVLIGTMSLWQGVDVPGSSLRLVIIDRLPFPRPDEPVLAARQERVDKAGGSGFMSVAVPRASLMLAQGVGRLIRSEADRGVVCIADSRLANARYGNFIRRSLPPLWATTDTRIVMQSLARLGTDA